MMEKLARQYADALLSLTDGLQEDKQKEIVETLFKLLKRNGHTKLLPNILSEYTKLLEEHTEESSARMVVAKESDVAVFTKEIEKELGPTTTVAAKVDDTIIGGYVYDDGKTVIDASYKRALLNLYRELTV